MQITTFALSKQLKIISASMPSAKAHPRYKKDTFNRNPIITKEKQWLSFEKRRRKREMSYKDRLIAYIDRLDYEDN